MKKTLGVRRTPWEMEAVRSHELLRASDLLAETLAAPCRIRLQGCWLVDASTVTPEDARRFMWEGLRTLRSEAKDKGVSESDVNKLIQAAFGHFHDAATDIYRTVCAVHAELPKRVKWFARHHGDRIWVGRAPECGVVFSCVDHPVVEDPQTVALTKEEPKSTPAPKDLFVACEEDRPVPVTVRFRKQKPLLNPDRDVLESFKP